eukprot:scaffold2629_cov152-Amphora_coffeaeformis.AAC.7
MRRVCCPYCIVPTNEEFLAPCSAERRSQQPLVFPVFLLVARFLALLVGDCPGCFSSCARLLRTSVVTQSVPGCLYSKLRPDVRA